MSDLSVFITKGSPNQTLETNCRPASPFEAKQQFECAVRARPCVFGGSRSALRSLTASTRLLQTTVSAKLLV